ncbi:hypothetical protein LRY60_00745 [Candidatus Woesebacteria bacterium]|nr:hypothetical protein [Candidatus Woesebacteria bacterium]MCD8546588.1 hypothetical protein [Candidatus Woesebacteria bacterium]
MVVQLVVVNSVVRAITELLIVSVLVLVSGRMAAIPVMVAKKITSVQMAKPVLVMA